MSAPIPANAADAAAGMAKGFAAASRALVPAELGAGGRPLVAAGMAGVTTPGVDAVVRTTPAECTELGVRIAAKLREATGPAVPCLPLRGLSALGAPDGPFHDPRADEALFTAVRGGLRGSAVELAEYDAHLNDPAFGRAAAKLLHRLISDCPTPDRS
ncbi:Tm-1-like ATP-binding domain-containing protein [Streptomyces sp. MUM 178J]|uniref:Tm-1-like ATP-binding domain-containing protein n=1 Tax=Streptomyces sp. MUM 178J TaxID=2791991 RepID=UPI001F04C296|nr:Tm-1-like ATP-binding domain-containing protein [Streptomyces sp. MUM 178J]